MKISIELVNVRNNHLPIVGEKTTRNTLENTCESLMDFSFARLLELL